MAYYKLVASGRSDVNVDELILAKDDDGNVTSSVSVNQARELADDMVETAKQAAARFGYSIEETEAPPEGAEPGSQISELQETGVDVMGESPAMPVGDAEVDQQPEQQSPTASQQGSSAASAQAPTAQSGSPSTSQTTTT